MSAADIDPPTWPPSGPDAMARMCSLILRARRRSSPPRETWSPVAASSVDVEGQGESTHASARSTLPAMGRGHRAARSTRIRTAVDA
jgi:hypothetical protein